MDTNHIKELIELMVVNDISRLEIREGDTHILLRRGQPVVAMQMAPAPAVATAPALTTSAAAATGAPAAPETHETYIRSPMVGTFYSAPDPESPAFANVGDVVKPDSVVCLVEAMKVFNEIKAEMSGRITKVLVKNAQAVEFDQPLFAVEPA